MSDFRQQLLKQVQLMVEQSGDPRNFDADAWLSKWLEEPNRALGGQLPAELLDTAAGQALVLNLLARMQSGAYS